MTGHRSLSRLLAIAVVASAACTGVSPLAPVDTRLVLTIERSALTTIGAQTRIEIQLPDGVEPAAGAVSWSTSAPSVAVVDDGVVTATGDGEARITAEIGGMSASTTITVAATIHTVASVRSDQPDTNPANDTATVLIRVHAD